MKELLEEHGIGAGELAVFGAIAAVAYIIYKGNAEDLANAAAKAAVKAATGLVKGAVTGAVTGVTDAVGIDPPEAYTHDPYVARYIMDDPDGGYYAASQWATTPALNAAEKLPPGSGYAPPANSKLAQLFPPYLDVGGIGGEF